jgi:hypothetical protein
MTDPRPDESDDRLFTDSFAPRERDEGKQTDDGKPEDELDKIEDLLPQAEPTEGSAPLP